MTRARFGSISKALLAGGGKGQRADRVVCTEAEQREKPAQARELLVLRGIAMETLSRRRYRGQKARLVRKERLVVRDAASRVGQEPPASLHSVKGA